MLYEERGDSMTIPESVRRIIGARAGEIETIGKSDASVQIFDDMVLKAGASEAEIAMLRWMRGRVPVPEVLAAEGEYLLMSRTPGKMLCAAEIMSQPRMLAERIAEALQLLWNADVTDCPYPDRTAALLDEASRRVEAGLCSMTEVEPETYGPDGFASPEALLRWLLDNRPDERPVLSHGDFCLPNVFADEGGVTGFIDVGRAGICDPYRDLAIVCRSLRANYEGKFARTGMPPFDYDALFAELGIRPDVERMRYYVLLDELF
jgi:kanamycin kinase/aminoglycoside 3'-phosphotransferase-3